MNKEWELNAACSTADSEMFFKKDSRAAAKALCAGCPVQEACLESALVREADVPKGFRTGIVAGLTGSQRWAMQQQRAAEARRAEKAAVKKPKLPGMGRPRAECGTRAAYQRHLRNKEPIDAKCRAANARCAVEYRATGSAKDPVAQ